MRIMRREVFDAFRALGVAEDKALKAAAALNERDKDVVSLCKRTSAS